jgi:hypothetical protein
MATRRPAGQCVWLSHNGAEDVNPLVIKSVELVPVIISLVFGDLLCGICHEATDCLEEFLDNVLHLDTSPKDKGSCHGQVDLLGQQAGLGQDHLPSRLWQAKASLWF